MSVDEFVKLILAVAVSLSILGISVQIMRLLGTFNLTLKDFRAVTQQASVLVKKAVDDYDDLIKALKGISNPISVINKGFLVPVSELAVMAGSTVTILRKQLFGKG